MADDVKSKSLANLNRKGRDKGSKNKSTILKDILKNGFETEMEKDFIQVVKAVVAKAKDGDMTAAKLLFERVLPVADNKLAGKVSLGEGGLTIVIERLEAQPRVGQTIEASEIVDAEIIED